MTVAGDFNAGSGAGFGHANCVCFQNFLVKQSRYKCSRIHLKCDGALRILFDPLNLYPFRLDLSLLKSSFLKIIAILVETVCTHHRSYHPAAWISAQEFF